MVVPGVVRRIIKAFPSIIQALALVAVIHIVGQGLIGKFGGARHRFSRNQYNGFGSDKVQKVIKYIDKNVPKYHPKGKKSSTERATTSTTTPAPPPPLQQLEEEQQLRLNTLHQTCNRVHNTTGLGEGELSELELYLRQETLPTKPMWQNLYCSKEHKLTYCPTFKSASTFLFRKLLLISPKKKYNKESVKQLEVQANVLARQELGYLDSWDEYPTFSKEGTTFLFVRHPFERILSAFRDKLEDPSVQGKKFNEYYYNKYGRRIVMHYRREKITGPSFKYPRFHEFLEFLLNRDVRYDDEHWAPNFMTCFPCHVQYNFIGHFETLYWDVHLLANKTGLTAQWDDSTDYFQSSTNLAVGRDYYSLVERSSIRKLYSRYKLEFDMFGYSPEEYIAMGKPGPEDILDTSPKPELGVVETSPKLPLGVGDTSPKPQVDSDPVKIGANPDHTGAELEKAETGGGKVESELGNEAEMNQDVKV